MRVAFFCPTVSGRAGIEAATRNLMAGFRELGDEVHLFLFGGTFDSAWLDGVAYTQIGSPRHSRLSRLVRYALGATACLRQWQPDVVICSDVTTIEIARLGRRLSGRHPTIASWVHFPLQSVRMKEKLRDADLHLAISTPIAEDLRALLPGSPVHTIFNAVDLACAQPVPRPETPSFLYVGRLVYGAPKRVEWLLRAIARVRGEWKLTLIGGPPLGEEDHVDRLQSLADDLGISSRLSWPGWHPDPWAAAGPTTAMIMPSEREGFPMVLIEAIAHGIYCVSSDCRSGPGEIILPGQNGELFPVGDVEKLTEILQRLAEAPGALPGLDAVRATAQRFALSATAQRARLAMLESKNGGRG